MAFVDEITVYAQAGRGGDGVVRWRHEKSREFGGPSGGNGGRGGDIYARAMRDISILAKYRHNKEFYAKDGEEGRKNSMYGKDGDNLYIDVPVGSIITGDPKGESSELLKEGDEIILLHGGKGGLGNEHFKSSTNQRPIEWTAGSSGESATFNIELQLIADAGLIGLPNAGKSSLLNILTNAKAKVGSYAFTTLDPNLGDMYGFILADIPGLIEGAAEGKGLGHKFLRHIARTKLLLHCISLEQENPVKVYQTVRDELGAYNRELLEKPEAIVLTKSDEADDENVKQAKQIMQQYAKEVLVVNILDDVVVKSFRDKLIELLRKLP